MSGAERPVLIAGAPEWAAPLAESGWSVFVVDVGEPLSDEIADAEWSAAILGPAYLDEPRVMACPVLGVEGEHGRAMAALREERADDIAPPDLPVKVVARRLRGLTAVRAQAVDQYRQKLEHDIEVAREIQESFLPKQLPELDGWELAAYFCPAREVAGDFYDAFMMGGGRRLGLVIADVCDKGVPAALFMALTRSLVRAFAQQHHSVSVLGSLAGASEALGVGKERLQQRRMGISAGLGGLAASMAMTNDYLIENHGDTSMFCTLFFAVLDPTSGTLAYINGGHNPPLIVGPERVKERLTRTGPAIGIQPNAKFDMGTAQLDPGDALFLYTDGVTEARNASGDFFEEDGLVACLTSGSSTARDLVTRVSDAVITFRGDADQSDDVTLLAISRGR